MKSKDKIFFSVLVLLFLSHILLPIIDSRETHQINYFVLIFALFWMSATFLVVFIALKNLGLKNFSLKGSINNNVKLGSTDMLIVKIAISLYIAGVSFAFIGIYFFDMM